MRNAGGGSSRAGLGSEQMYKAAIIGCGMIAGRFEDFSAPETYSHAKAYRRNSAFRDIAFFDCDTDRAIHLAAKAGGKAYSTVSEIMDSFCPDVVSVCTPDNLHFSMIESLLLASNPPKIIFAEKPVCNDHTELTRLRQLESAGNSVVLINHSRRFDVAHQRLKVLLNSGDLGPLVKVHVDYYGGWRHLGVHIIDILQYIVGTLIEIDRVEYLCESKYIDDPTLNMEGRIDNALIKFEGFQEDHYQILDMNIMCQRGQIKITDFGKSIEVFRKTLNVEQENVLVRDQTACGVGMQDCIGNAIGLICNYLDNGNLATIEPYGLVEAQNTMNTIWKGSQKYAAQS
jgi:predicted dehydrogenase